MVMQKKKKFSVNKALIQKKTKNTNFQDCNFCLLRCPILPATFLLIATNL